MSATATDNAIAAPDWQAITHDVLCPLCDYNLRGLSDPRCPECGARFDWAEVTDPEKRLHPYVFEHHPERNVRAFVQTLVGTLRPRRFWSGLSPSQPVRPGRMVAYWTLTTLIASLAFWAEWVRATVDRWGSFGMYSGWGPSNPGDPFWSRVTHAAGSAVFGGAWEADRLLTVTFRLMLLWAVWPWLTVLALRIFQWSMWRARIKDVHVVRCVVYAFDVGAWLGLAGGAWAAWSIWSSPPGGWTHFGWYAGRTLAVLGVMLLAVVVRLWVAYRRYMRFDHALGTVMAAQAIVALVVLNWIFLTTSWAWRLMP